MYLNEEAYLDKVYGCWLGKSIGGTLGTPFEGRQELLDVTDFNSPPGNPLPNDDLDLQLVWLKALEDYGPLGVNEQVLGEYWINYIPPHWNEYGIGKSNMKAGILPPLSGDYQNAWKHSNGAWIRSEIWACCAPGCPEIATKYAWYDACVDHGTGEGTYAELFTASVESAAFVESDRDRLIEAGLSYIPEDCRVARSIRIVLDSYQKGLGWKEARNLVLEDSADLGWFQAPANVAFVVIGWLYGEGDYKKSLLIAVSCGDDTDCTGATLGSILGIINGARNIPEDWKKYVGDQIVSIAIDSGSLHRILPKTCTELTARTFYMCRQVLMAHRASMEVGNRQTVLADVEMDHLKASAKYKAWLSDMSNALSYNFIHARVLVKYISGIDITAFGESEINIRLINPLPDARHYDITYHLPCGFELVEGAKHIDLTHRTGETQGYADVNIRIRAGQCVQATNRGIIQMLSQGRPTPILIPLILLGK